MALLTCSDAERSTTELLRGVFVTDGVGSYAVRTSQTSGGVPIDCDQTGISTEAMLRGAVVRIDGEYAFQTQ